MGTTRNYPNRSVMARVMRQGKRHQEDFYLHEYGSWKKAEKAAQKWVDEKIEALPPRQNIKNLMTKRNSSGVVGVNLSKQVQRRPYGEYEYWKWIARWPNCPNSGGVSWSTNEWGDEDAFVLAVITRQMESAEREKIKKEFTKIKGTEEYQEIIKLKKQYAP